MLSFFVIIIAISGFQSKSVYGSDIDNSTSILDKNLAIEKPHETEKVSSPRVQTEEGVPPLAVVCNPGFQLVLKASDGSPACVVPSSIETLVERGWAQSQDWENHD